MDITDKIDRYLNEAKLPKSAVSLPDSMYYLVGFGRDKNGNSVVKLYNDRRGNTFSIQINNPSSFQHTYDARKEGKKPKEIDKNTLKNISMEVQSYIERHGTAKMK